MTKDDDIAAQIKALSTDREPPPGAKERIKAAWEAESEWSARLSWARLHEPRIIDSLNSAWDCGEDATATRQKLDLLYREAHASSDLSRWGHAELVKEVERLREALTEACDRGSLGALWGSDVDRLGELVETWRAIAEGRR